MDLIEYKYYPAAIGKSDSKSVILSINSTRRYGVIKVHEFNLCVSKVVLLHNCFKCFIQRMFNKSIIIDK